MNSNQIAVVLAVIVVLLVFISWQKKRKELMDSCDKLDVHVIDSGKPGPCVGLLGGVHGNEPAGAVALEQLVFGVWNLPIKRGKLIVIPWANKCGLSANSRLQPLSNVDINRSFTENGGTDYKSRQIVEALKDCDMVIDIHEGWGFHKIQPGSIGSTLTPSHTPEAELMAADMLQAINKTITNPDKKFTYIDRTSCDIPSALSCYMDINNRPYVLIEITGQNDIQPIALRVSQAQLLITSALQHLEIL